MISARIISIILVAVAVAAPARGATAPVLKPEDAYLSADRYLNRYFGLCLKIPKELNLIAIPVPKVQGATRWLLALGTVKAMHPVTVTITAAPPPKKGKVASALSAEFSDDYPGPGKPARIEIGGETFWRIAAPEKPQADTSNILEYGGMVRDYLVTIRVSTEMGPVPDDFAPFIESAVFIPPAEVEAKRTADMVAYAGPALPELGHPTAAIASLAPGRTEGQVYTNNVLGIAYQIPDGLEPRPEQQLRQTDSGYFQVWGGNAGVETARKIADTCTRPLLLADDGKHRNDGHVSAAVMITAVDPRCLQGARFPVSVSDGTAEQSMARALADQVHTDREGVSFHARTYALRGHIFLNVSGIFYGTEPGTGLKIPNRIRLIATQLKGYLIVWTFVAPDRETLERVSNSSVRFYPAENMEGAAKQLSGTDDARK